MSGPLVDLRPHDQCRYDVVTLGDVNRDHLTDFLLTGAGVAHVVAGLDHEDGDDDDDDEDEDEDDSRELPDEDGFVDVQLKKN